MTAHYAPARRREGSDLCQGRCRPGRRPVDSSRPAGMPSDTREEDAVVYKLDGFDPEEAWRAYLADPTHLPLRVLQGLRLTRPVEELIRRVVPGSRPPIEVTRHDHYANRDTGVSYRKLTPIVLPDDYVCPDPEKRGDMLQTPV